jgi:hypothetical protein
MIAQGWGFYVIIKGVMPRARGVKGNSHEDGVGGWGKGHQVGVANGPLS